MCNKVTLFEDTKDPEAESLLFVANEIAKIARANQMSQTDVFCLTGITSHVHLTQLVYMRDTQTLMNALSVLSAKYETKKEGIIIWDSQQPPDQTLSSKFVQLTPTELEATQS